MNADHAEVESRLIDNGDGTVTDMSTALQWQKWDDGARRSYADAQHYASGLRLAGYDDWRLPRKEELVQLAQLGHETLRQFFPGTKADAYWADTSSEEVRWADNQEEVAYAVEFAPGSANYGADVIYPKLYDYYVRAVRNVG